MFIPFNIIADRDRSQLLKVLCSTCTAVSGFDHVENCISNPSCQQSSEESRDHIRECSVSLGVFGEILFPRFSG
jgi:hypothetical protein